MRLYSLPPVTYFQSFQNFSLSPFTILPSPPTNFDASSRNCLGFQPSTCLTIVFTGLLAPCRRLTWLRLALMRLPCMWISHAPTPLPLVLLIFRFGLVIYFWFYFIVLLFSLGFSILTVFFFFSSPHHSSALLMKIILISNLLQPKALDLIWPTQKLGVCMKTWPLVSFSLPTRSESSAWKSLLHLTGPKPGHLLSLISWKSILM